MSFLITTTGAVGTVTFTDLGGRAFTHPTSSYDLESEYSIEDIRDSSSVLTALSSGYITAVDGFGNTITATNLKEVDDIQNSLAVGYSPNVPSNWGSPAPNNVKDALDQIAFNLGQSGTLDVDAQQVDASDSQVTSSTAFVDLPNMTLNTSNSVDRAYLIFLNVQLSVSPGNKDVSLRLLVGGTPIAASERTQRISSNNSDTVISIHTLTGDLGNAVEIKAQWATTATATVTDRTLTIYSIENPV